MATPRRRKSLSVIEQLLNEPYRFDFFQAVRTIEYAANSSLNESDAVSAPLSLQAPPSREFLRFKARQQLSFTPSEITEVTHKEITTGNAQTPKVQWQMEIAFMGLTGSEGVMRYYLSEAVLKQLKLKNNGLRDFLEIFNHRAITLYYKAWAKYQMAANFETQKLHSQEEKDPITQILLSLIGLGLPSLQYRQPYSDESLISLAGFLSRGTCTANGLERMLRSRFKLDVAIKQFTGAFSELTDDIVTKIGTQNNALGQNTFLGSRCHHSAGKFTVAIKPRNTMEYEALAPGSPLIRSLMSFVRQAAGPELIFDLEVARTYAQTPSTQLRTTATYAPTLGWNTLLGSSSNNTDLLLVRMSSDLLPPDDTLPLAS